MGEVMVTEEVMGAATGVEKVMDTVEAKEMVKCLTGADQHHIQ